MKNKGKPQGFREVKVLRWLCINPLLFFQTSPSSSPGLQRQECTAAPGNTRSDAEGCGLLMLGFSALIQESPKSPITQDEAAIMLQIADQHYRKDVGAEVIRFMGKKKVFM